MKTIKFGFLILGILFAICVGAVQEPTSDPESISARYDAETWGAKPIKSAHLFPGESINYDTLELSWTIPDLSIPGDIPIKIFRTYENFDTPYGAWNVKLIDARWDISLPSISFGVFQNGVGQLSECMNNSGIGYRIKNYNVNMPNIDGFREIGRSDSVSFSSNTVAQYENNWIAICEDFTTRSNSFDENGNAYSKTRNWGVTLKSPDGLIYRFAFYGQWKPFVWDPLYLIRNGGRKPILQNFELKVTDIEDQFGNYITFDYQRVALQDGHVLLRPLKIRSNDNRTVDFSYDDSNSNNGIYTSHKLDTISYGSYVIDYNYNAENKLSRVLLPEGLAWDYTYHESAQGQLYKELKTVVVPQGAEIAYEYDDLGGTLSPFGQLATNLVKRTVSNSGDSYLYEYSQLQVSGPNFKEEYEYETQSFPDLVNSQAEPRYLHKKRVYQKLASGGYSLLKSVQYDKDSVLHGGTMDWGAWNSRSAYRSYTKKTTYDQDYSEEWTTIDAFGNPLSIVESGPEKSRTRTITYWNSLTKWLIGYKDTETLGSAFKVDLDYDSYGRLTDINNNGVNTYYTYSGANVLTRTDALSNVKTYSESLLSHTQK